MELAYANHNKDFMINVTNVIKQVGPLIPSIAAVAATLSELDKLKMNNIFRTCFSIKPSNISISQQSVIVHARSVKCVMQLILNLKKELNDSNLTTQDSQLEYPLTKNQENIIKENEQQTLSTKKNINQKDLKLILLHTDFNEVLYSPSKTTTINERVQTVKTNLITNRHSTSDFLKKFMDYNVTSMRQFNTVIRQDLDFRTLYLQLPYNLTNQIISKGLTICQSAFKPTTFIDKYNWTVKNYDKLIKRLSGLVIELLENISSENGLPKNSLLINLFDCLLYRNHKRMTLGLIGSSNSGKTFLVDLFTANFETYEIGNIIPPAKDTLSEFWLMNCVYASVKRMEEFYIPTVAVCNEFKKLLEGNKNQIANVKYKENQNLQVTPTFLTMNGQYVTDITKFCSNEFEAINNRCYLYMLNSNLSNRKIMKYIDLIKKHRQMIMFNLYEREIKLHNYIESIIDLDELKGYSDDE